jgi:hypothetical protein
VVDRLRQQFPEIDKDELHRLVDGRFSADSTATPAVADAAATAADLDLVRRPGRDGARVRQPGR